MTQSKTYRMVMAAFMLTAGLLLPFLTGQVTFGTRLLPMHFPVLIGGMLLGPYWGFLLGAVTPLLRSMLFGMPVMMPMAVGMAFELATYGAIAGLLYRRMHRNAYVSLMAAMIGGRVVWGIASTFLYGMMGKAFGLQMFLAGALINAVPGIILQIILIPLLMRAIERSALYTETP